MISSNGSKKSKSGYGKKLKSAFGFGKSKPKTPKVEVLGTGPRGVNLVSGVNNPDNKNAAYIKDPKKDSPVKKDNSPAAAKKEKNVSPAATAGSKEKAKSGSKTPVVDAPVPGADTASKAPKADPAGAIEAGKRKQKHKLAPQVPFTKEEITATKTGMSPFLSTLVAGGILLSLYVVGKAGYKWFTTRRKGKKAEGEREGGRRRWVIEKD